MMPKKVTLFCREDSGINLSSILMWVDTRVQGMCYPCSLGGPTCVNCQKGRPQGALGEAVEDLGL